MRRVCQDTGLDIQSAHGYVVRVENDRITGVWNGPKTYPVRFGTDYFLPVNEPLTLAGETQSANEQNGPGPDRNADLDGLTDPFAEDAPDDADDGPSLYDADPFGDGEEL